MDNRILRCDIWNSGRRAQVLEGWIIMRNWPKPAPGTFHGYVFGNRSYPEGPGSMRTYEIPMSATFSRDESHTKYFMLLEGGIWAVTDTLLPTMTVNQTTRYVPHEQ